MCLWILKLSLIVICSVVGISCEKNKPIITHGPTETFGLENQPVSLQCRIQNSGNAKVKWYQNGTKISDMEVFRVHEENLGDDILSSELSMLLSATTVGSFYCNASTHYYWEVSTSARVAIAFMDDKFIQQPQSKTANVGETALFACHPPDSSPRPTLTWFKDGKEITSSTRVQVLESGSLRVEQINWSDAGLYWCVATSFAFQKLSEKASLNVRQRPYFIVVPFSQSVPVNGIVELSCQVSGEPQPVVMWRRDPPTPVIPASRATLLSDGSLRLVSVQPEDAGDYICQASSDGGIVEAVARISIISPPGFVITSPGSSVFLEGTVVQLFCSASGSPNPELRWFHQESSTYFISGIKSSSDRISVSEVGSLIIKSARISDTGIYECRASSSAGFTRTVTHLAIQPNAKLFPSRIGAVSLSSLRISVSKMPNSVTLLCSAPDILEFFQYMSVGGNNNTSDIPRMNPKLPFSLRWYRENQLLGTTMNSPEKYYVDASGSLEINQFVASDLSNYTCSVTNNINKRFSTWNFLLSFDPNLSDQFNPYISLKLIPPAPTNLRITASGGTWVALNWDYSPSQVGVRFQVFYLEQLPNANIASTRQYLLTTSTQYLESGMPNDKHLFDFWEAAKQSTRDRHFRLQNLLPDSGYWLEVRALNSYGWSEGCLIPQIFYTHTSSSDPRVASNAHELLNLIVPSSDRGQDFQEMLNKMNSITVPRMSARSLSSSEILVSWSLRATSGALKIIDGFQLSARPVFMSRCLATSTSDVGSHLVTASDVSERIHCSFNNELVVESFHKHTLTGRVGTSIGAVFNTTASKPSIPEKTVLIYRSMSRDEPSTGAVIGGLHPFTCYEVTLKAFKNDYTYGKVWSRETQPKLVLSLDSSPSKAPKLLSANWLYGQLDVTYGGGSHAAIDMTFVGIPKTQPVTTFVSSSNRSSWGEGGISQIPNGIRLNWTPLDVHFAHGALIGYSIYLVANETIYSHARKVSPDVFSQDILNLNPNVEYTIYLAGVTCRGEGVRGPGYRMPILFGDLSASPQTGIALVTSAFPIWAYGVVSGGIVAWTAIGLLVFLCTRRRGASRCLALSGRSVTDSKSAGASVGSSGGAGVDNMFKLSRNPESHFPPSSASSGTKSSMLTDNESCRFQRKASFSLKPNSGTHETIHLLSHNNSFGDPTVVQQQQLPVGAQIGSSSDVANNGHQSHEETAFSRSSGPASSGGGSSATTHGSYYRGVPPMPPMGYSSQSFISEGASMNGAADPAYSMISSGVFPSIFDGNTNPMFVQNGIPLSANQSHPVAHSFVPPYGDSSTVGVTHPGYSNNAADEVPPYASSNLMSPENMQTALSQMERKSDFSTQLTSTCGIDSASSVLSSTSPGGRWSVYPVSATTVHHQQQQQHSMMMVNGSVGGNSSPTISSTIPPPPPYPPPPIPSQGSLAPGFGGDQFRHLSDDGSLPSSGSYFTGYYAPEGVVLQSHNGTRLVRNSGNGQESRFAPGLMRPVGDISPSGIPQSGSGGAGSGMSSLSANSSNLHSKTTVMGTAGQLHHHRQQQQSPQQHQGSRNAVSSLGSRSSAESSQPMINGSAHRSYFTGGTLSSNESGNSGPQWLPTSNLHRPFGGDHLQQLANKLMTSSGDSGCRLQPGSVGGDIVQSFGSPGGGNGGGGRIPEEEDQTAVANNVATQQGVTTGDRSSLADNMTYSEVNSSDGDMHDGDDELDDDDLSTVPSNCVPASYRTPLAPGLGFVA